MYSAAVPAGSSSTSGGPPCVSGSSPVRPTAALFIWSLVAPHVFPDGEFCRIKNHIERDEEFSLVFRCIDQFQFGGIFHSQFSFIKNIVELHEIEIDGLSVICVCMSEIVIIKIAFFSLKATVKSYLMVATLLQFTGNSMQLALVINCMCIITQIQYGCCCQK